MICNKCKVSAEKWISYSVCRYTRSSSADALKEPPDAT